MHWLPKTNYSKYRGHITTLMMVMCYLIKNLDHTKCISHLQEVKIVYVTNIFSLLRNFIDQSFTIKAPISIYLATKFWMYFTWIFYFWPCILLFVHIFMLALSGQKILMKTFIQSIFHLLTTTIISNDEVFFQDFLVAMKHSLLN